MGLSHLTGLCAITLFLISVSSTGVDGLPEDGDWYHPDVAWMDGVYQYHSEDLSKTETKSVVNDKSITNNNAGDFDTIPTDVDVLDKHNRHRRYVRRYKHCRPDTTAEKTTTAAPVNNGTSVPITEQSRVVMEENEAYETVEIDDEHFIESDENIAPSSTVGSIAAQIATTTKAPRQKCHTHPVRRSRTRRRHRTKKKSKANHAHND